MATTTAPQSTRAEAPGDDPTTRLLWAVESVRLAEARLARRRQADCGPGHSEREAMRFVAERSDAGEPATPTALAEHLGLTTPSVSAIVKRLVDGGLVETRRHEADGRSKLLVPASRSTPETADRLAPRLRRAAASIDPAVADAMSTFLEQVRDLVEADCR